MQVVMRMGVKVVSVERRDTPTRYDLFYVRVVYVLDESDVPRDRMIFCSFFPFGNARENAWLLYLPPPPPPSLLLSSELLRVSPRGYRYRLGFLTYFRKI
jgi:hypothetical protein